MVKLGFGITRAKDQYYKYYDIPSMPIKSNTLFALNFPGVGLSEVSYNKFAADLSLASQDTFRCEQEGVGSCSSLTSCEEALPGVWELSFQVHFQGLTNYLQLPLASLAVSTWQSCTLQVFKLPYGQEYELILGAMVF